MIQDAAANPDSRRCRRRRHVAIDTALTVPDGVGSPLRAVMHAGLVEPTGRAVTETLSLPIHNHALLIGIRALFGTHVNEGSPAQFAIRTSTPRRRRWRRPVCTGTCMSRRIAGIGGAAMGAAPAGRSTPTRPRTRSRPACSIQRQANRRNSRRHSAGASTAWWSATMRRGGEQHAVQQWLEQLGSGRHPGPAAVATDRATVGIGETAHIHVRGPFAGARRK